jgi:hypothetical protein
VNRIQSLTLMALTTALLVACSSPTPPSGTAADLSSTASDDPAITALGTHRRAHGHFLQSVPVGPQGSNLTPLPDLRGPKIPEHRLGTLAITANPNLLALRMLIITAGVSDPDLDAAKAMLGQAGIPYDVLDATVTPLSDTTLMATDGSGRYQGVVLTNNSLVYQNSSGGYQSALTPVQWTTLWQYEQTFRVRQVSMYTFPSSYPEDYGLRYIDGSASGSADITPSTGQSVTSDLRAGSVIKVRNAYNYPATALDPSQWAAAGLASVQPILSDAANPLRVFAATSTTTSGRERLALTMAHNQYFLHSQLLGYALVNWVTRGLYLGEYRRYNQVDIDDWFLFGDHYNAVSKTIAPDAFRMSASDALAFRDQQTAIQNTYDVARGFRFAVAYNGGGANTAAPLSCDPNVVSADPLTSVSRCLANAFNWVSHTRDHLYMDFQTTAASTTQIAGNQSIGATLGLVRSANGLITGDMSGLGYYNPNGDGVKTNYGLGASNTNFLKAAVSARVRYLASNHSVDGQWNANCATCGVPHPLSPSILLIPRWPTNIFYYATTPDEITTSYNAVYGPGGTLAYWDHALSYAEILDKESDTAISHILSGAAFPHYMHTDNLYQYAPGKSIAADWENALLTKYSKLSTLPLNTLTWDALGQYVALRTGYMKNNVKAVLNVANQEVTITAPSGGAVYATGVNDGPATVYNGRYITNWDFSANQSLVVTVR